MASSPAPPSGVTPVGFAQSLLRGLGDPVTPANVQAIQGWEAREGGNWKNSAHYNPLNTTENVPGATSMNGVGVKSYQNWNQGLQATESTLKNGYYGDILGALHSGHGLSGNLSGLSKWSGGGYSSIDGTSSYNPPATAGSLTTTDQAPTTNSGAALSQATPRPLDMKAAATAAFLKAAEQGSSGDPLTSLTQNITSGKYGGNGSFPTVARAQAEIGTTNKQPSNSQYSALVTAATDVANHHYNYEWGGGHNATAAPTHGTGHGSGSGIGYDCSGALSDILMQAGALKGPLVASQFADLGKYIQGAQPGVGGANSITVYANATHTFAKIGNQYFGTSASNPGGGAGFFKAAQTAGYQVWHVNL